MIRPKMKRDSAIRRGEFRETCGGMFKALLWLQQAIAPRFGGTGRHAKYFNYFLSNNAPNDLPCATAAFNW